MHGSGAHTPAVWPQNHPAAPELYCWLEQALRNLLDASSMWLCQRQRTWKGIPAGLRDIRGSSQPGPGGEQSWSGVWVPPPLTPQHHSPHQPPWASSSCGTAPPAVHGGYYRGSVPRGHRLCGHQVRVVGTAPTPTGLSEHSCRRKHPLRFHRRSSVCSQAPAVLWEEGPASGNDTAQGAQPPKSSLSLPTLLFPQPLRVQDLLSLLA